MKGKVASILMYTIENIVRIAVVFVLALTLVIMMIAIFDDSTESEANIGRFNTYTLDKGWTLQTDVDSKVVDLPLTIDGVDEALITNTLPDDLTNGMSLMFRASFEGVKIYIDGKLREEYTSESLDGIGYNIPSAYIVVDMDKADAGKEIAIDIEFKESNSISEVKLSYGNNVWFDIIKDDIIVNFSAVFTLVLGVALYFAAVTISLIISDGSFKADAPRLLGLLMVDIALWIISESKLRQFVFKRASMSIMFSYILVELICVLSCMYFDEVQHRIHHKSYLVLESVSLTQLFACIIMHTTGGPEFRDTLVFALIVSGICALVTVINIIIDIKNGAFVKYSIIMAGMIFFIVLAVCELIGFITNQFHVFGVEMGVALLILTACTVIQNIHDEVSNFKQREENNTAMTINTILTIASTIDAKDGYTGGHSQRVGQYAERLAREMAADYDFTEEDIRRIRYIGLVHDIGKIGVPDNVLNKAGKLTDEEFDAMKQHTVIGYEIMKSMGNSIEGLLGGIRHHHERFDGSGYPDHLADAEIPLEARIIAIADSYDAMTTNRVYRRRLTDDQVKEELIKGAGTQFDPALVEIFIGLLDEKIFEPPVPSEIPEMSH